MKTLMGIDFKEISMRLAEPLPQWALKEITNGSMKGKTDISPAAVIDRLCEVFGPNGLGWWIEPAENGVQETHSYEVTTRNGEIQTWYATTKSNYRFLYRLATESGDDFIAKSSYLTDSSDNMDRGFSIEGAESALMKQAFKLLGGMSKVYSGDTTHSGGGKKSQNNGTTTQQETVEESTIGHNDPNVKLKNTKAMTAFYNEVRSRGMQPAEAGKRIAEAGQDITKLTHGAAIAILFPETESE